MGDTPDDGALVNKESVVFLGITVCASVLVFGLLIIHALRYCRVDPTVVPDSWIFLAIGAVSAVILEFGAASQHLERVVAAIDESFAEIFFTVLLPPIVFQSGLELNVADFFKRFASFSVFAVLGTVISTAVIGLLLWAFSYIPGVPTLSVVESLLFGTLLSATDTVAVIAVFDKLHVPYDLYAMVFGESVLNDAVAIVLYRTLVAYETGPTTAAGIATGVGMFFVTFIGSIVLGVAVGVLSALLFKHVRLTHDGAQGSHVEKALLAVTPFVSYMLSEGLHISGVVAILFTGITMGMYTIHNVAPASRQFLKDVYAMMAVIGEGLAFVYIGIALPELGSDGMRAGWPLAVALLVLCLLGRACSTWACTAVVNRMRASTDQIEPASRFVIWMAGLRGGVAFALASAAAESIPDAGVAQVFPPVALFIVLTSMLSISGSIGWVIKWLKLADVGGATVQGHGVAGVHVTAAGLELSPVTIRTALTSLHPRTEADGLTPDVDTAAAARGAHAAATLPVAGAAKPPHVHAHSAPVGTDADTPPPEALEARASLLHGQHAAGSDPDMSPISAAMPPGRRVARQVRRLASAAVGRVAVVAHRTLVRADAAEQPSAASATSDVELAGQPPHR